MVGPTAVSQRLGEPGELGSGWRMGDVYEAHDDRVLGGFVVRSRRGARAAVHLN